MEVVEVNDVILNELRAFEQVAHDTGVVRDGDTQGVFDCSHGADGVNGRSDTANALRKEPGISRVPFLHDQFDAPEHHTCAPGVYDVAILYLNFDAQVTLDAGNRVDGYPLWGCHSFSLFHKG
jgi:hypothetical protein